jgi:hypothetical protein
MIKSDGVVVKKDVKTVLTEERKIELAMEVVGHTSRYDDLEEQKKEITKDLSAKMKQERADKSRKAKAIRTGVLEETVDCYEEQNFSTNAVYFRRCDTSERVAERPMRQDERQLSIDGAQPSAPVVGIDTAKKKKRMKAEGAPDEESHH